MYREPSLPVPPRSRVRVVACAVVALALVTLTAATTAPDDGTRTAADPAAVVRGGTPSPPAPSRRASARVPPGRPRSGRGSSPSPCTTPWWGSKAATPCTSGASAVRPGPPPRRPRPPRPTTYCSPTSPPSRSGWTPPTRTRSPLCRLPGQRPGRALREARRRPRRRTPGRGRQVRGRCVHRFPGTGRLAAHPARLPALHRHLARQAPPLLLTSPRQFRPGGPPALASAAYARDVRELKVMGAKTGSGRNARQTETALFFSGNLVAQVQTAVRDHAARHRLGIAETARLFAAVNASATDAVVTTWDAKLHYGFWRPITAIRLAGTDGNPATTADPAWEPLLPTPPHPDYIAGHTTVTAAVTRALTGVLGTSRIDLDVPSEVTGTTRHYRTADELNRDVVDARVWGGVHSRTADVDGCRAGTRVAAWALDHYFQPVAGDRATG
ncbi:vanadium-dependent haloperoxidase [Streptomyces nogalater]